MSATAQIAAIFQNALLQARQAGAKLSVDTLQKAALQGALDDGVEDAREKFIIARYWGLFGDDEVTDDARTEFYRMKADWKLPQPAQVRQPSWSTMQLPFDKASQMLQLTDGRLMCQVENGPDWWLLSPSADGSYATGKWEQAASMSNGRLYYASAVLADGRVFVAGGEYTSKGTMEDNTVEIYDPVKNTWTTIPGPAGWDVIGDAPCAVLPDGRVLIGSIEDGKSAIFDPKTNTWSDGGAKQGPSAEESWVLLPDGSVLTVDCDPARQGKSSLWVPGKDGSGKWIDAGDVPVPLVEKDSEEIGAGLLLPDGRAFYLGATGQTAFYTPGKPGTPGQWAAGPKLPLDAQGRQTIGKDAPAALMPNGHVLISVAAENGGGTFDFGAPTFFYDLDPKTMTCIPLKSPVNNQGPPFEGRMMILPNGQTAYTQGSNVMSIFDPGGAPRAVPAPRIQEVSKANIRPGETITVMGQRFNGSSQTVGYGDDSSAATNYPLARLTASSGEVRYARTHDHSTMAVATGDARTSTQVDFPADLKPGLYNIEIVANGVASRPFKVNVLAPVTPAA
jgi:hypothetical protein